MASSGPPARLTARDVSGAPVLVDGCAPEDALARLASYEDLRAELTERLILTAARIDDLRAQGRVRTVTYRQLTANRVALKETLGYFEERGL